MKKTGKNQTKSTESNTDRSQWVVIIGVIVMLIPVLISFTTRITRLEVMQGQILEKLSHLGNGGQQEAILDCASIGAQITSLENVTSVTSPTIVSGRIVNSPSGNNVLWLVVFDQNNQGYIYAEQIAIQDSEWEKNVSFHEGGMVGHTYDIRLVLASQDAHSSLNEYFGTMEFPVEGIVVCDSNQVNHIN